MPLLKFQPSYNVVQSILQATVFMKGLFGPLTVADPVSEVTRSRTAGVAVVAPEVAVEERQPESL